MAQTCEEILLSDGLTDEAYSRYALAANRKTTNLATFRAVAAKYPEKNPADILRDLVAHTPGEEGKWFAAAKSVGLYDEAIDLANRTPCDPKTLTRAARDMAAENPRFAVEAGLAALRWLVAGYGYDIIAADVSRAPWRNVYNFGGFGGSVERSLQHDDAHFDIANWGTVRFAVPLPDGVLDRDAVAPYIRGHEQDENTLMSELNRLAYPHIKPSAGRP